MHFIADLGVGEKCAAVDPAALADDGLAAELGVGPITVSLPMVTLSSM